MWAHVTMRNIYIQRGTIMLYRNEKERSVYIWKTYRT